MEKAFRSLKPVSVLYFLSITIGILCAHYIPAKLSYLWLVGLFLGVVLIAKDRQRFWLISFTCLFFCIGFNNYQHLRFVHLQENHLSHYLDDESVIIKGQIVSFVQKFEYRRKAVVDCREIMNSAGFETTINGRITLSIYGDAGEQPKIFDTIQFKTKLKSIRNFNNPGRFDYRLYMQRRHIHGTGYVKSNAVQMIKTAGELSLFHELVQKLEIFRNQFEDYVTDTIGDQAAADIIISLVTGKKERIEPELRDLFSKLGIGHLLAISGLHLSIVGLLSYKALYHFLFLVFRTPFLSRVSWLNSIVQSGGIKKVTACLTLFPLLFYTAFSGFSPSTQRAMIMAAVFLFSVSIERETDLFSSLFTAGLLILLFDCAALFSVSFQFSFIAVFFILTGLRLLSEKQIRFQNYYMQKIFIFLCVTFFAGTGTIILTAYYFNMVSFCQLLTNLIAIPIIGFIVLPSGFLALISFSAIPGLSDLILIRSGYLIEKLLIWFEPITHIPFTWNRVNHISGLEVLAGYSFLAFFILWLKCNKSTFKYYILGLAVVLFSVEFGSENLRQNKEDKDFQLTVLDVGQGLSSFVQTRSGTTILIDGGGFSSRSRFDTGRYIVAPYLWLNQIDRLDAIILTHPDADHLNGLVYIVDNFKVMQLIKNHDETKSDPYRKLMLKCMEKGVDIVYPVSYPSVFKINDLELIFFHAGSDTDDLNNNSLVFKVNYKKCTVLFCGDILKDREKVLTQTYQNALKADLIIAPHHGSATSSHQFFLEKVKPESVIIPCGWQNRYRFPHPTVVNRYKTLGTTVYRTDLNGAVQAQTSGDSFNIRTYKDR